MDRLSSMAVFAKAVEMGSFAAAADASGMSAQMVAKHVASLEARLGARLLNRTTRRQSLTAIGSTFYDRCKLVLADVAWAEAASDEARGAPTGRLKVNAPVSFGTHSLMPLVTRYLDENPAVEIDLTLTDRFVDAVEEGYEAVFRVGPVQDNQTTIELSPFRLCACASPGYLRARGTPSRPDDLAGHDCLGHAHWSRPTDYGFRFTEGDRIVEPAVRGRLRCNEAKALVVAALQGAGIAMVAEDIVAEYLADGRLVRVLPGSAPPPRPVHLIFHPDRRQSPKLRSFINAVVEHFGRRS